MTNHTILLVEDNDDDVELTKIAFKELVNDIVIANDGPEALEYLFDENNELPTMILLDIKLPRIDGIGVLKEVKKNNRTKRIPIIILTSTDMQVEMNECYNLGANSFIRKPIDFKEFIEAVKQIGMYWLVLNYPSEE